MPAAELSFRKLESLPPHPEKASVAIQWMVVGAVLLTLLALQLVLRFGLGDEVTPGDHAGCTLVTFPNAGVPYQAGYRCRDGSVHFEKKPSVDSE